MRVHGDLALSLLPAVLGAGLVLAAPSAAVTLQPGDLVLVQDWVAFTPGAPVLTYRMDPATLDASIISDGPLVSSPAAVTVDRMGRILVADLNEGIVHVDAATGSQSVLVGPGALGGSPAGICLAPGEDLFVSVRGGAPGVVRISADGSTVAAVTTGGRISQPGNLALGPDGALYVSEGSLPSDNGGVDPPGFPGYGSIVRIDVATGAQQLTAADSLFVGPFEIAFVSADEVWTAQWGADPSRRSSCFVSTRISDQSSTMAPANCHARGIAVGADGTVYVSACTYDGPDCGTPFTSRLPGGPTVYGKAGRLAVVPHDKVPVRRGTWGGLKTIYR